MVNSTPITSTVQKAGPMYVYLIAFIAGAGAFIYGFDIVLMSGAILFMEKYFTLTPALKGFAMTSAVYGVLLGLVVGSSLADRIGRKWTLILSGLLFGISAVGTAIPRSFFEWNVYRIVGGVGGGLACMVSPMLIAELAPSHKRGLLVTINQLSMVIGAFASNVTAWLLAEYLPPETCWRWMFGSEAVPIVFFMIGLIYVPRSPRWLAQKNRFEEARRVLILIDGHEHAERELQEIRASLNQQSDNFLRRVSELFSAGIRMALLIAVALAAFQQMGGVSTVIFYSPTIFQQAGIALETEAIKQTIILVIWNIICTVIAMLLVDRVGRRPLLLWGTFGMAIGQLLMGINFYFSLPVWFLVVSMFIAIGTYIFSLAPLTWLIMSEIFPTQNRAAGMAVAALVLQLSGLLVNQIFPMVVDLFKKQFQTEAGAFWIFAGICLAAYLFSYFLVPETKGKTLEEIAGFWKKKS